MTAPSGRPATPAEALRWAAHRLATRPAAEELHGAVAWLTVWADALDAATTAGIDTGSYQQGWGDGLELVAQKFDQAATDIEAAATAQTHPNGAALRALLIDRADTHRHAARVARATDPGLVTFPGRPGTHLSNQAADELRKAGFPVLAGHVTALDRSVSPNPAPTTEETELRDQLDDVTALASRLAAAVAFVVELDRPLTTGAATEGTNEREALRTIAADARRAGLLETGGTCNCESYGPCHGACCGPGRCSCSLPPTTEGTS